MRPVSSSRDKGLVQMQMKAYVDTETGLCNKRERESSCRMKETCTR